MVVKRIKDNSIAGRLIGDDSTTATIIGIWIYDTHWTGRTLHHSHGGTRQFLALIAVNYRIPSNTIRFRGITFAISIPKNLTRLSGDQHLIPFPFGPRQISPLKGLIVHGEGDNIEVLVPVKVAKLGFPGDLRNRRHLDKADSKGRIFTFKTMFKWIIVKLTLTQIKGMHVRTQFPAGNHIAQDHDAVF